MWTQSSGGRLGVNGGFELVLDSVDVEGREKRVRIERVVRSVAVLDLYC